MKAKKIFSVIVQLAIIIALIGIFPASAAPQVATSQGSAEAFKAPTAKFSDAVAFDKTAPLRDLAAQSAQSRRAAPQSAPAEPVEVRPDRGPEVADQGYSGDGALQGAASGLRASPSSLTATRNSFPTGELRRHQQPGQFQHFRLPRQSARPGR